MNDIEILHKIESIFHDVLDDNDLTISRETTANDVEDWDSLNHVQIIVAVESEFSIRFTTREIEELKNIGQMCDLTANKLNNG
jgi:acyl carrier protein